MKTTIKTIVIVAIAAVAFSACKKDKKTEEPEVQAPPPPVNTPEIITTLRLAIKDSASGTIANYAFKDPDGDGGLAGAFLNSGADSVFTLMSNKTYFTQVYILDESKTPTDSISNIVAGNESKDHMLFYNGDPASTGNLANTIINPAVPYTVLTNGSNIKITYLDIDNGTPQRNIGLSTRWRTAAATGTAKNPFQVTLRHQPDVKNGLYTAGETDIQIEFKVKVN